MTEHLPPDEPAEDGAAPDPAGRREPEAPETESPPPGVPEDATADSPPAEPWSEAVVDGDDDEEDTQELEVPEPPLTRPPPEFEPAPVKSAWPAWAWMMVAVAVLVLGVGVAGGVLVPALVLDIVSFWPGFLFSFLLAAAVWPLSRRFSHRLKATVPLLVLTWLGLGVALHLAGWEELPSSAGDLRGGAAVEIETGSLTIEMDGTLTLAGASQPQLYVVEMLRRGGPVGAPQALETTPNGSIALDIVEVPGSSWYAAAGWDVLLADSVTWSIQASAAELAVDAVALTLDSAALEGSGFLSLGVVEPGGTVTLVGDFEVTVPPVQAVVLEGTATVPTGWVETETGMASPAGGEPYMLVVPDGSTVRVTER